MLIYGLEKFGRNIGKLGGKLILRRGKAGIALGARRRRPAQDNVYAVAGACFRRRGSRV
jgi:hypothetical protein